MYHNTWPRLPMPIRRLHSLNYVTFYINLPPGAMRFALSGQGFGHAVVAAAVRPRGYVTA